MLKPNGECGGNNFYDEALAEKLRNMTHEERSTHILMQKLHPMTTKVKWSGLPEIVMRSSRGPYYQSVCGFCIGNQYDGMLAIDREILIGFGLLTTQRDTDLQIRLCSLYN